MEIDPNLITLSKDGKFVYPVDSITGAKTLAEVKYFCKLVVEKFGGSLERFTKEYVTRETRKYLHAGFSREEIKEIAAKHKNNKLPKLDIKLPRVKRAGTIDKPAKPVKTQEEIAREEFEEKITKIYPWSNNPDYFRSPLVELDVKEAYNTCFRTDIYLDSKCMGCPIYQDCACSLKKKVA
jgi:hypothetical protein